MKSKNLFNTLIAVLVVFALLVGGVSILNNINKSSFEILDDLKEPSEPSFRTLHKWDFSEDLWSSVTQSDYHYYGEALDIYIDNGDWTCDDGRLGLICQYYYTGSNYVNFGYNENLFLSDFSYYTLDCDVTLPSSSSSHQYYLKAYSEDDDSALDRGSLLFEGGILYDYQSEEIGSYDPGETCHITFIISSNNIGLVYLNGEYVASISNLYNADVVSVNGFTFKVTGESCQDNYYFDNVEIRSYDPGYAGPLSELFDSHADLSTCSDSVLYEG